eukprot:TRINITY_DN10520_c0_g2_i1.p1 TRINITY_DN10520_c0_g2~~TRINITY_DN10520_c0_g2_i1.p1  ORF type:complete len:290 (+),score=49.25 TRINITY_DN10520_c0_g2_i1:131-1000(+)
MCIRDRSTGKILTARMASLCCCCDDEEELAITSFRGAEGTVAWDRNGVKGANNEPFLEVGGDGQSAQEDRQEDPKPTKDLADKMLEFAEQAEDAFRKHVEHPESDRSGPTLRGKFFKKSAGFFGKGSQWPLNVFVLEGRRLYYDKAIDYVGDVEHKHTMVVDAELVLQTSVSQKGAPTPHRITLAQRDTEWHVCFGSEADLEQAKKSIMEAKRPIWRNEELVHRCNSCKIEFSVWNRKHHCRQCGEVCCDKCASKDDAKPLPHFAYFVPVRVCRDCDERLGLNYTTRAF